MALQVNGSIRPTFLVFGKSGVFFFGPRLK